MSPRTESALLAISLMLYIGRELYFGPVINKKGEQIKKTKYQGYNISLLLNKIIGRIKQT